MENIEIAVDQPQAQPRTLTASEKARRANLRPPWKKGECPNPSGKTGLDARAELTRFISGLDPNDPKKRNRLAVFLEAVFAHAIGGDAAYAKLIFDRIAPATQIADISVNLVSSDEHKQLLNRLRHGESVIRFNGNGNGHATDRVLPSSN